MEKVIYLDKVSTGKVKPSNFFERIYQYINQNIHGATRGEDAVAGTYNKATLMANQYILVTINCQNATTDTIATVVQEGFEELGIKDVFSSSKKELREKTTMLAKSDRESYGVIITNQGRNEYINNQFNLPMEQIINKYDIRIQNRA